MRKYQEVEECILVLVDTQRHAWISLNDKSSTIRDEGKETLHNFYPFVLLSTTLFSLSLDNFYSLVLFYMRGVGEGLAKHVNQNGDVGRDNG